MNLCHKMVKYDLWKKPRWAAMYASKQDLCLPLIYEFKRFKVACSLECTLHLHVSYATVCQHFRSSHIWAFAYVLELRTWHNMVCWETSTTEFLNMIDMHGLLFYLFGDFSVDFPVQYQAASNQLEHIIFSYSMKGS